MAYKAEFDKKAEKDLRKMDKHQSKLIKDWVKENLDGCANPRVLGKELTGNLKGYWRYYIDVYRLICDIQDGVCKIIIVKAGHRKEVYRIFQNL